MTTGKNEVAHGLAIRLRENSATTTTMKTCPQGSYRKDRENDEPITGLTDFDRLVTMTTDFWTALDNGAPNNKCICGKVCLSSKGLKIHQTKMGCLEKQRPVAQEPTHKTPNDTGPEANHRTELVRVSLMASDLVRQRIKFPPSKDMQVWQELDGTLVRGLKKAMKKEGTMKTFSDFIYASCLEKFGNVESRRPTKPKESRRQLELRKLKIEKKALCSQWKRPGEVERVGLSILWKEVKRRINILRKAEKARQKTYERRRARQEFFRDPYRYGRSLLEPPKSGTITVGQAELEACLTKRNQLSLHVVWLDLAIAYGSVPHQLLWKTLAAHHVPRVVIEVLQEYFNGFVMFFHERMHHRLDSSAGPA